MYSAKAEGQESVPESFGSVDGSVWGGLGGTALLEEMSLGPFQCSSLFCEQGSNVIPLISAPTKLSATSASPS